MRPIEQMVCMGGLVGTVGGQGSDSAAYDSCSWTPAPGLRFRLLHACA